MCEQRVRTIILIAAKKSVMMMTTTPTTTASGAHFQSFLLSYDVLIYFSRGMWPKVVADGQVETSSGGGVWWKRKKGLPGGRWIRWIGWVSDKRWKITKEEAAQQAPNLNEAGRWKSFENRVLNKRFFLFFCFVSFCLIFLVFLTWMRGRAAEAERYLKIIWNQNQAG